MQHWIAQNEEWIALLGIFSIIAFVASLFLVPLIIINLPVDYFTRPSKARSRSLFGTLLHVGKNLLGVLFLIIGFLMLVLPGQGLLTLLLGLSLIDFPSKRLIQIKLIRMHAVSRSIKWMRRKANRAPLQLPDIT